MAGMQGESGHNRMRHKRLISQMEEEGSLGPGEQLAPDPEGNGKLGELWTCSSSVIRPSDWSSLTTGDQHETQLLMESTYCGTWQTEIHDFPFPFLCSSAHVI